MYQWLWPPSLSGCGRLGQLSKRDYQVLEKNDKQNLVLCHEILLTDISLITVEPPWETTSRRRPPLMSDRFSKHRFVSQSNHYICDLT